jgi:hypothetical protein
MAGGEEREARRGLKYQPHPMTNDSFEKLERKEKPGGD